VDSRNREQEQEKEKGPEGRTNCAEMIKHFQVL
jgi:hypothetical protein